MITTTEDKLHQARRIAMDAMSEVFPLRMLNFEMSRLLKAWGELYFSEKFSSENPRPPELVTLMTETVLVLQDAAQHEENRLAKQKQPMGD